MNQKPKKLLDQVRDRIRVKQYSHRTEQTYVHWIRKYILYNKKRHPKEMGILEIESFLTHLAVERKVSSSTQNQALSAILFLYREILGIQLPDKINAIWGKRSNYMPTVLSKDEVKKVIRLMNGTQQLMAKLMYGSGIRVMECVRLRVKDIDFEYKQIIVFNGKGDKHRRTLLPESIIPLIQNHLERVKGIHKRDLSRGYGYTHLPPGLEKNTQMPVANGYGNLYFRHPESH